jgi:hypothetical protein
MVAGAFSGSLSPGSLGPPIRPTPASGTSVYFPDVESSDGTLFFTPIVLSKTTMPSKPMLRIIKIFADLFFKRRIIEFAKDFVD